MKDRLAGATKGHGLLKRKAEALKIRFRVILLKIIEVRDFYSTYALTKLCVLSLDKNGNG